MNISITPELEQFIQEKVKSGMYQSASEVVREALRLLSEREEIRKRRLEQLNQEIQLGLDQLGRGEFVTAEQSKAHMLQVKQKFLNGNNNA